MLYLIATPIGNLKDITQRALEVMNQCDYLLAEDTRRSQILLKAYDLKISMKSYHKINEKRLLPKILEDLSDGKTIGLLSDAGTPTINDPGALLVKEARKLEIGISSCPGCCSVITALSLSGLQFSRFEFVGFLPKKKGQRKKMLESMIAYDGASIAFESPYRILKTIEMLEEIHPEALIVLAKELTKKFEKILTGTAREILSYYKERTPKGEFILIISS